MRRPQSAKLGHKGNWGQGSESDFQQQQNLTKGPYRKNVKLMKPDLTTNDFARILPKKIYQDKQRLYSEALQLKQNLNETLQENIRMKTRITILQKQKDKLTKHIEANRQNPTMNKANSRLNILPTKSGEKESMMIRNLKKMVRQGKQENDFLKQENAKIKKAIKYTKINELQIERKMLQDENKRMVALLEQMNDQLVNQDDCQRRIAELQRDLDNQKDANRQLNDANLKYIEYNNQLEQKITTQGEKAQARESKFQREMALNKRKLNEALRQVEDLKKELNGLKTNPSNGKSQVALLKPQTVAGKNEAQKPKLTRPMSSNPYKGPGGMIGVRLTTESKKQEENKENEQMKNIKLQNEKLKEELMKTQTKLEQTERQMKKQKQVSSTREKSTKQIIEKGSKRQLSAKPVNENNIVPSKNSQRQGQTQLHNNQSNAQSQKTTKINNKAEQQNYEDDDYAQNYENEFQQKENTHTNKNQLNLNQPKESVQNDVKQIDQYKKDFQAEEEEQPLYIKENSPKKKRKSEQKDEKKKKDNKKQAGTYKPDKKVLSQIKELLTYRMKAQRYPYEQLKRDIEQAKEKQFSLTDLKGMFINEPFYLTPNYTDALIKYCFESESLKESQILSNQVLLTKLRKVIDQFALIDEKEEEDMLLRIAEMVTEYPEQLQTAFQKIKNGQQTVAKQDLIEMFQNLELQQKYIELVIQQLSLCSTDLLHLNFIGFFERFYVENMSGVQNGQIDEEQMESSSEEVSKNFKSKDQKQSKHQVKAEFEDNDEDLVEDEGQKISLGNQDQQYADDSADLVSDDGPI